MQCICSANDLPCIHIFGASKKVKEWQHGDQYDLEIDWFPFVSTEQEIGFSADKIGPESRLLVMEMAARAQDQDFAGRENSGKLATRFTLKTSVQ
jgi:hypothetical protein